MSIDSFSDFEYQAGGSLPPQALSYITRQADLELYNAVLARQYCYVLNARQMGKSSLRIRTMVRLLEAGIACTEIELSGIGSQEITATQWYGGLIQEMVSGLGLQLHVRLWLEEQSHLSPVQCLGTFIEDILLKQIQGLVVIFIDEIDSILSLNFDVDEFFSLIRNLYDKRATYPEYERLSFVFLGVATPAELIQDKGQSAPFNIGTAITLQGFRIQDCDPLIQGFKDLSSEPKKLMESVLDWTGGQPFLTQKICSLLVQSVGPSEMDLDESSKAAEPSSKAMTQTDVEQLIQTKILDNWESQDEPEHLRTIRDRLLRNATDAIELLKIYHRILRRGSIPNLSRSPQHLELRLSGLVELDRGQLRVKNKIYQQVFSDAWVVEQLSVMRLRDIETRPQLRPQSRPQPHQTRCLYKRMLRTALVAAAATVMTMGIRSVGLLQAWELAAYDRLMALRPPEGSDPRLFLIKVTETDVQAQPASERGGVSLSDTKIQQLLAKLSQENPRAIGFDIYREHETQNQRLAQQLSQGSTYFICKYGQPGVPSSSDLPLGFSGFNNTILDQDNVVRRQILAVDDASPCNANLAFSLKLVERYLYEENLGLEVTEGLIGFGKVMFPALPRRAYPRQEAEGYQLLLNYRATAVIADSATLGQVLSPSFDLERLRDRIILVGTIAPSFNDHRWFTPHLSQPISGVEIQGHMTSQLLSAVLDQRPLMRQLSLGQEWAWVAAWSAVAATLVGSIHSHFRSIATVSGLGLILIAASLLFLIQGIWLPLVPAGIGGGLAILLFKGLKRLY